MVTKKMNPEIILELSQEQDCKEIVTRALKISGLKPGDFPVDIRQNLVGIVRANHPAVRTNSSPRNYGVVHLALLKSELKNKLNFSDAKINRLISTTMAEAQKIFHKK